MPYTSPRLRLRPLNFARLKSETETVLHKVFMQVTSSMVKVYIRDRVRDRDLKNGLYESETETLESRDTRDETRRESRLCLVNTFVQSKSPDGLQSWLLSLKKCEHSRAG